jgi:hypothetical protein
VRGVLKLAEEVRRLGNTTMREWARKTDEKTIFQSGDDRQAKSV